MNTVLVFVLVWGSMIVAGASVEEKARKPESQKAGLLAAAQISLREHFSWGKSPIPLEEWGKSPISLEEWGKSPIPLEKCLTPL